MINDRRWVVEYHRDFEKEIRQLPKPFITRVRDKIESLKENPKPHGSEKLSEQDIWRVRVGPYRVLYTIDDERRVVSIFRIGHRRDVYRDL
jgi:mRNA interferase RelE/StbE